MNELRNSQVDQLITKDLNLRGRRVVGASASQNTTDYTIQQELTDATSYNAFKNFLNKATNQETLNFGQTIIFNAIVRFVKGLITNIIQPPLDSTTAIKFTKADGTTVLATWDTANSRLIFSSAVDIYLGSATDRLRLSYSTTTHIGTVNTFDGANYRQFNLDADGFFLNANSAGAFTLGAAGSTMGFFAATPAAKQTLSAYTTNSQSAAYVATPASLALAATLADLNILRVAYENIRASYDDLRTKLKVTTLVG